MVTAKIKQHQQPNSCIDFGPFQGYISETVQDRR